ncbi:hypothetical protein NTJ28_002615 [Flavobacterium psychrophilum]|nr:hypothetical protein [Flavobacterium psychrophilum]
MSTLNGQISQHVEYIAFGEVLFEEHSSSFKSPYLFNGKELDRETNLTNFGARYLDMKTSLWLNVDPLAEHPKQVGKSPYSAFNNNPIRYNDPTGMIWEDPKDAERLNKSVNSRIESVGKDSAKIQAQIDKGGLSDKKLAKLEGKLADNTQKVGLLNQSLADIKSIGDAKETYTLASPSQSDGTHGVVKGSDGVIKIEGSNTGLHLHEIRHQANGEPVKYEEGVRIYKIPKDGILLTQFKEQQGFVKREYFYTDNNNSRKPLKIIINMEDINSSEISVFRDGTIGVYGNSNDKKSLIYQEFYVTDKTNFESYFSNDSINDFTKRLQLTTGYKY